MQNKPASWAYADFVETKRAEYGDRFDSSDLDARFAPYFKTGQRIKVEIYGQTRTGTVGVTTGWRPVFLLMHNRRCVGSSNTLDRGAKLIAVKSGRTYHEVSCAKR